MNRLPEHGEHREHGDRAERDVLHPAPVRLEALAAGDDDASVAAHLEGCEACATYVARLKREAAAFRGRVDPVVFAKAIAAREAATRPPHVVTAIGVVAPAIAIAAAALLWLRTVPDAVVAPSALNAPVASNVPATPADMPSSEGARFKGGLAVAVVRERGGGQERLTGPFEVRPSDRIRVEIAVDREEAITAGLLADDGTWTVLEAPSTLAIGTHYSELAARFDESPTQAFLLVGSPVDVARARSVGSFDGIIAWRVTSVPAQSGRP
jgi:hypothetical protein